MTRLRPLTRHPHDDGHRPVPLCRIVLLGLLVSPCAARAQWLPPPVTAERRVAATETHPHSPTYWVEGAVVGGAVLGSTATVLVFEVCGDADGGCDVGDALLFSTAAYLLGGTIGSLVGGAFSAPHPRPFRGHPAHSAAIGASVAALWSFGLLAGACLNGCRDDEVVLIVTTMAFGALAGLLLGL